ncbi:beta-ketoacyl synthase domain-containing protein [Seiridium cupressi]
MGESRSTIGLPEERKSDPIAVVGLACKFPGASSVEEYWRILDRGVSMVSELPPDRFPNKDHWRSTNKSIFFGNFLDGVENFDHRFFKKTCREAASMDPGHRLLLEVSYQALESSGDFGMRSIDKDLNVGYFFGVCVSDYTENVASHPPNAFSALGTLRALLTGRTSHFFVFTGESIRFDTACSSSTIAIDAAGKAISYGDCTSAIAGGVLTTSFLSDGLCNRVKGHEDDDSF